MAAEPELCGEFLDKQLVYFDQMLDIIFEYPFDAVFFGDDWGQQKSLIMGPVHWRNLIKPRLAKFYKRVKDSGRYVFQHSCGDCSEILPDLVEIGLDCYQTFQPEIYDIEKVKKEYGGKLTFWGGISTQQLLASATPEQVRAETIRIIKIMKKGGGYIAAPTHAVEHDVPPENIMAMFEVFENQEKYI